MNQLNEMPAAHDANSGDPAPLATAQDRGVVRLVTLPETHRPATPIPAPGITVRLPIDRLSEEEARHRAAIERIARSGIDVMIARAVIIFATVALIQILAAAAFRLGAHS